MIGRRLSHFRILDRIGEGGMGVVYRAEDEKLKREVALKVLPPERLADEERRLRFVREARTAAAVTHPNIAVVHEIDEAEGVVFIAMELIEGRTLRETAGGKPLPLREALRLGVEIAEGLSAAHQAKVIHRDLKPDNVIVTPGGHVKILDFGLAKLLEERGPSNAEEASKLATISDEMTQAGRVIGTAAYMSPEQARGLAVDARSDLFSFGIVLYEMATGKAPFRGSTSMDTLTAILREQPVPAVQLNPEVPAELERIIGKCLEKDPAERYQDGRDLVVDLRKVKRDSESQPLRKAEITTPGTAVTVPRRAAWKRVAWPAAVLVVLGLAAGMVWKLWPHRAPKGEPTQRQITSNPVENPLRTAEISPDGLFLAYLDKTGIQVRRIETGETQPLRLPGGFEVRDFDWLPDGTGMLLTAAESTGKTLALWSVSLIGGAPRKILEGVSAIGFSSWMSPDGKHIFYSGGGDLWIAGPHGETPRKILARAEGEQLQPVAWSPTSRRIAYVRSRWGGDGPGLSVESRDLDGGAAEGIVSDPRLLGSWGFAGARWLPDGRFLFVLTEPPLSESDTNLWSMNVDPETGKSAGAPQQVTHWSGVQVYELSATADGRRLTVLRGRTQSDIYLADVDADGFALHNLRRLTLDDRDDLLPLWTPDSRSIVFSSLRGGTWDIFKQALDSMTAEAVLAAPDQQIATALTPDGVSVLYLDGKGDPSLAYPDLKRRHSVVRVPLAGGPPSLVAATAPKMGIVCPYSLAASCVGMSWTEDQLVVTAWDPVKGPGAKLASVKYNGVTSLSPDGARLAILVAGEPGDQIMILTLSGGQHRRLLTEKRLSIEAVGWSASSDALFATARTQDGRQVLARIDIDGGTKTLLELSIPWAVQPAASPDGRHLAYLGMSMDMNAWMLENF